MRWNEVVTLHGSPDKYQDEFGAWHEGELSSRDVFCNEMQWGSMFMGNLRSNTVRQLNNSLNVDMGQTPEVQLQVRCQDYQGESLATYHGLEYFVLYETRAGELSILGLVRRIGNV